jgi:aspartyl-tRNA(Asn)/glutamyl-tRNA(Gln) amidotransferase subunit C
VKIDQETLEKIAHLARLEIKPEESPEMIKKLEGVLNWMEQLNEIDTDNVAPLTHMTLEMNAFREDEAKITISREEGLSNAPKHDEKYFRVAKVM